MPYRTESFFVDLVLNLLSPILAVVGVWLWIKHDVLMNLSIWIIVSLVLGKPVAENNRSLVTLTAYCHCLSWIVHLIWAPSWENQQFAYAKTKAQISFAVTAKLISTFVFTTRIVQCLLYLTPKFQASSLLLCLYRPVCVGPVRKPHCWFSHEAAHLWLLSDCGSDCRAVGFALSKAHLLPHNNRHAALSWHDRKIVNMQFVSYETKKK